MVGSANKFVQCHLCSQKSFCKFAATQSSYIFHSFSVNAQWRLEDLSMATMNCPLKKLLERM